MNDIVKYEDLDFVDEGKNWNRILKDGEIRICHFPMFPPEHQDRPAIVVYNNGFGPFIMPTAHVDKDDDEWKKYEENVFIDDWKQEKFKLPSYANTGKLLNPEEVKIGARKTVLTKHDYDRIVKPTIDRLTNQRLDELFESFGLEALIELIK